MGLFSGEAGYYISSKGARKKDRPPHDMLRVEKGATQRSNLPLSFKELGPTE